MSLMEVKLREVEPIIKTGARLVKKYKQAHFDERMQDAIQEKKVCTPAGDATESDFWNLIAQLNWTANAHNPAAIKRVMADWTPANKEIFARFWREIVPALHAELVRQRVFESANFEKLSTQLSVSGNIVACGRAIHDTLKDDREYAIVAITVGDMIQIVHDADEMQGLARLVQQEIGVRL